MKRLLIEGLEQGAIGLSVGLEYFPGRYAGPSEVEALTSSRWRPRRPRRRAHARHLVALRRGMEEAIGFATGIGCRLQISHVAPMGRSNWGEVDQLFDADRHRPRAGVDIAFDVVPYTTWTLAARR